MTFDSGGNQPVEVDLRSLPSSSPEQQSLKGSRKRNFPTISFRFVVMPLFALILCLSVVTMSILHSQNASAIAEELTNESLCQISKSVETTISNYTLSLQRRAGRSLQSLLQEENLLDDSSLGPEDFPIILKLFYAVWRTYPALMQLRITLSTGDTLMLFIKDAQLVLAPSARLDLLYSILTAEQIALRNFTVPVRYTSANDGKHYDAGFSIDLEDFRDSIPFNYAVDNERSVFSPLEFPEKDNSSNSECFPCAHYTLLVPVYRRGNTTRPDLPSSRNTTAGVLAFTYSTSVLVRALAPIQVGDTGFAALISMDRAGRRWSIGDNKDFLQQGRSSTSDLCREVTPAEACDPILKAAILRIPTTATKENRTLHRIDYELNGALYRARYQRAWGIGSLGPNEELNVVMLVVVPDTEVSGRTIGYQVRINAIIGSVCCGVVLLLALAVVCEISHRMRIFRRDVKRISAFELDSRPGSSFRSFLSEVNQLAKEWQVMKDVLGLIGGLNDAVVVVEQNGKVKRMNSRAMEMFGFPRGQYQAAVGVSFPDTCLIPNDRPRFYNYLFVVECEDVCVNVSSQGSFHAIKQDNSLFPVEISVGVASCSSPEVTYVLVIRDVSETHNLLNALQSSERRASTLYREHQDMIQTAALPIFGIDNEWHINIWNGQMATMQNMPRDEALGKPLLDILPAGPCRTAMQDALAAAFKGDNVSDLEIMCHQYIKGEKRPLIILLNAIPRRDSEGNVIGLMCVSQDITEKRRMIEMEAASAAKNRLIAFVCHEVRTPLNGIMGMEGHLRDTIVDSNQLECLDAIRICSEQLLSTVNDLLDISKMEAGMLRLESVAFDLRTLVEHVVEIEAASASSRGIEVASVMSPYLPNALIGDPTRLRQVIINLVHNACKFTEQGHVIVRVTCDLANSPQLDSAEISIAVEDTGIGISDSDLEKLFQPYVQANSTITRKFGGTGMGLSIAKQLTNLMGGDISATSVFGKGACFKVTLPLKLQHPSSRGPPPPVQPWLTAKVLVVSVAVRQSIECMLSYLGVSMAEAEGDQSSLQEVSFVDAYQLDEMMIKSLGTSYVIAVASAKESAALKALHMHRRFLSLVKPVRLSKLEDLLAELRSDLLNGRQLQLFAGSSPPLLKLAAPPLTPTSDSVPHLNEASPPLSPGTPLSRLNDPVKSVPEIQILQAEDNPLNQKVTKMMLYKLGYGHCDIANNGLEAFNMAQSKRYHLIFMDCQMPGMDGWASTAKIREYETANGIRRTPIVALTANAMSSDVERCLEIGMDAVLTKPLQKEAIRSILNRFVPLDSSQKVAS